MITVLGSNGMLGRYVSKYLSAQNIERKQLDAANPNFVSANINGDIVVNCIGVIKPKVDEVGTTDTILVNSVFPHRLADYCEKTNKKLIHITTDCVFNGKEGRYREYHAPDALDLYGRSKSLGEPENCTVIRTSIIGEEIGQSRSLLEWVKLQAGKECNGFMNHWWNGVTCLELAKIIERMIDKDILWSGVRHIHSPVDVSKHCLLEYISKAYDLGITVKEVQSPEFCDRTLRSSYPELPSLNVPELPDQLKEMKGFLLK